MQSLAEQFSPEEVAYFGEETLNKHAAELENFPAETIEPVEQAEEAPAAAEKPAEKPVEAAVEPPAKPENRMVDIGALHAARAENKELKEQHNRLEGRFNELLQTLRQPQQPQEQPKTIDEDPLAAVKAHDAELAQFRQAREAHAQYAQLQNVVSAHETQFRAEHADYDAALQHLTAARRAEYTAMGVAPHLIDQALQNDAVNVAAHALRIGRNPAEIVYALAQSRGYAQAKPETSAVEARPAEVPADKQMEMLEAGARSSKSLTGGGTAVGDVTLEAIANMDSKEIGALSEAQWRKAMLGRA